MAMEWTRREAMKMVGMGALAMSLGGFAGGSAFGQAGTGAGGEGQGPVPYELPPLPYGYDALDPVINEELLKLHHDKHHAGYVKGLNTALEKLQAARKDGDMANVKAYSRDLAFNGSGHVLHTLYWNSLTPNPGKGPSGELKDALNRDFGSIDAFRAQFTEAAKAVESNGWGLLVYEPIGKRLLVMQAEKHQNLTIWGVHPLLCLDVWEHAYYLQYQNNRGTYVDKAWDILDWEKTAQRFSQAVA